MNHAKDPSQTVRVGVASFRGWLARQAPHIRRDLEDVAKRCALGSDSLDSTLAAAESGMLGDWRIPLFGLGGCALRESRHEAAIALCEWARECAPLGVVGRHFILLSGYEAADRIGWLDLSLGLAWEDATLVPDLIEAEPMFRQNEQDSISFAMGVSVRLEAPERVLPLLIWAIERGMIDEESAREWLDEAAEKLPGGASGARAAAFLKAANTAGLWE